jgi:CHAT domain-containing protein
MRRIDFATLLPEFQNSLEKLVSEGRHRLGVRGIETFSVGRPAGSPETSPRQAGSVRNNVPEPDSDSGSNENAPLRRLYELVIEPISDLLPDDPSEEIVFMPQGALFLVPFAALQGSDGKYLIEKHAVLMAPSIQVLELTGRRNRELQAKVERETKGQTEPKGDLVVGNPLMPRFPGVAQPLPPLPAAELEAEEIARLLGVEALTGAGATKKEVISRMSGARYVHLATHGILDDKRGFASAMALAPSAADSGLLSADEIADLQLQAELVVLSACNTGRGRITGDGVIGLSRSFISAGAPSVLVSLWSVPDTPTARLMTEFYKNLENKHGKAQALRLAMLATMEEHPKPLNWAAFTLIGESAPSAR